MDTQGSLPKRAGGEPPRLAFCGNVFPAETPGAVYSALDGPVSQLRGMLRRQGHAGELGFGLYLAAAVARQLESDEEKRGRLMSALSRAGVEVWTANAFPYGGFHGSRVKEAAFLPDWRDTERLSFTCHVIEVLGHLMMPGARGSLSTCPVGYGPEARRAPRTVEHLRRVQEHLRTLEDRLGVRLVLAIEPEPDGAFERVRDLVEWLERHVLHDVAAADRRIGVCWDLCHSAVVGESPADVVAAVAEAQVPIGKVQISAALEWSGPVQGAGAAMLQRLGQDPYFHQVRGRRQDGTRVACRDLPHLFERSDLDQMAELRIHCHVPVHRREYEGGLRSTDWRRALRVALQAGLRDFELETYTLPVLPDSFVERAGLVGTLAAELEACRTAMEGAAAWTAADGGAGATEPPEQEEGGEA